MSEATKEVEKDVKKKRAYKKRENPINLMSEVNVENSFELIRLYNLPENKPLRDLIEKLINKLNNQ